LARKLSKVTEAAEELRQAEESVAEARERLREAMREARDAGASYALLGRLSGLSRARVSQILRP
jgi:hypothetical protein